MVLYFGILESNSLNIVNQYMNDKGSTDTNLPFWYNVNDNDFILRVSSRYCKCYTNMPLHVGFEEDVEYNTQLENSGYTCILRKWILAMTREMRMNEIY